MKFAGVMHPLPDLEVAPFTGAWIEIDALRISEIVGKKSHPSRVRGLKCFDSLSPENAMFVAPFTGAWIEIPQLMT